MLLQERCVAVLGGALGALVVVMVYHFGFRKPDDAPDSESISAIPIESVEVPDSFRARNGI